LLTLVNSVNTRDADLKLFFHELERIGRGEIGEAVWREARAELWAELAEGPELLFEGSRFQADQGAFEALTPRDVLQCAFNALGPGEVEVWVRPSNRQEMAFKLKSAERPFALIKIGDISGWLKEELEGYTVIEGFEDEGFFERLNRDDSDINILMGSRSFYEGWDSNRPNVITFINIGTGTEARKFILQSVGRGVRIEPVEGQRRRLTPLYNAKVIDETLFQRTRDRVLPLETLFLFGTNRNALQTVISELDQQKGKTGEHELSLAVNQEAVDGRLLLIPVYRASDRPLMEQRAPAKFPILAEELDRLRRYVEYLGDDRLLLALHNAAPRQVALFHRSLAETNRYYKGDGARRYGDLSLILPRIWGYFDLIPQEVERLKPLGDEIRHFRQIKVFLEDISALQARIRQVQQYPRVIQELREKYEAHQLSFEQFMAQAQDTRPAVETRADSSRLEIRHIAKHYYVPVILSHDERIDYIRHIIHQPSEVRFLDDLEAYARRPDSLFGRFDWWLFSKLDETLDGVYIPYYDPGANAIRRFNPDFIFWLQRDNDYYIVFVDPKGMQQAHYEHKVDGYRQLFVNADGTPREFACNGLTVRVRLALYTADANQAPLAYRAYWFDRPEGILDHLKAEYGEV
jgi:hypothetical protein